MGRWGMGLASSEEFSEVKEWFFKEFYNGVPVDKIEKNIINYYHKEYSIQGMLHEVYFALAECEWKCGFLNNKVLNKVKLIINNNEDLEYLKSLGASDNDLNKRAKILNDFISKITLVNPKPLKQIIKKPYKPKFDTGDFFSYKINNQYRHGVVLQAFTILDDPSEWSSSAFEYLVALSDLKTDDKITVDEFVLSPIYSVNWYRSKDLIKKKDVTVIVNIKNQLASNYSNYFGAKHDGYSSSYMVGAWGNKETFIEDLQSLETIENENSRKWQREMNIINKPIKFLFDENNIKDTHWRK